MSPKDVWPTKERREFPRRICAIESQMMAEGYSVAIPVKVADISLGGCYIEMFSPLPKNSLVELAIKLDDGMIHVSGKVRSSQTGFGMGIAFTSMSPDDFEKLKRFAPAAATVPALAQPASSASKSSVIPYTALPEFHLEDRSIAFEAVEAIARLLCRKGVLTTSELLEEIEKSKMPKT